MKRIGWGGLLVAALGCSGVRFGNAALNEELPDDWKNRNLYQNTAIFKHQLQDLAGSLLQKRGDGTDFLRVGRVVHAGYVPTLKVIDDGKVYESKIDRGASAQGSYLAWAASLQASQKAGVLIQDVSMVFIPYPDIPWSQLAKIATDQPPAPGTRRYYVQGVLLSSIVIEKYQEIESSASGVISATIGVGGKVFAREGSVARDFRIALELVDIDQLRTEILTAGEKDAEIRKDPTLWAERCMNLAGTDEYARILERLSAVRLKIDRIREGP